MKIVRTKKGVRFGDLHTGDRFMLDGREYVKVACPFVCPRVSGFAREANREIVGAILDDTKVTPLGGNTLGLVPVESLHPGDEFTHGDDVYRVRNVFMVSPYSGHVGAWALTEPGRYRAFDLGALVKPVNVTLTVEE